MVNKAILVGNVGADPVIKSFENERSVASFSLATTKRWKDKSGELQERTTWHNIVAWNPHSVFIEKVVRKGSQLYIEGEIVNRSYEKDGETKYISEIEVRDVRILGKKEEAETATNQPVSQAPATNNTADDSVPF